MQRNILKNPFEKFERKRFTYQCRDLALISFDAVLWDQLTLSDLNRVKQQMIQDGISYFDKLNLENNNMSTYYIELLHNMV